MLLFGTLFSFFERRDLHGTVFSSRYFWHGVVFTTLFNLGVFYAIATVPDWMWMYFLDDAHNTFGELVYIFIFLYYLPYALGFYLGFDIKNRSTAGWWALILFFIGAEAWLIDKLFDRYSVVGTRQEFFSQTAASLFSPSNPIAPVMNGSVAAMVAYFFFVVFLYRRGKKIRL